VRALRSVAGALVILGVAWVLLQLEISAPADAGTWSPGVLEGEVVYSLLETRDALLAGTHRGLYELHPGGSPVLAAGVPGPVYALGEERGRIYAATGDGVYVYAADGEEAYRAGLPGIPVRDVDVAEVRVWAATGDGLYELAGEQWERTWPREGEPAAVEAVLAVEAGILAGTREGLLLVREEGAEPVWEGGAVVALGRSGEEPERVWAGVRGEPSLLVSGDSGRTWEESGAGIRLEAVNDLRADPVEAGRLFAGGSGLADGENLAGVMHSEDGGESWQTEQNRLSNTHVFALAARREPVRLEVSPVPGFRDRYLELPVESSRFYAGTNGSGVYTYRPQGPLSSLLGGAGSTVRFLEPIVAGAILLLLVWSAYYYGRRPSRAGGRSMRRVPE
jgi:hypothetical protein